MSCWQDEIHLLGGYLKISLLNMVIIAASFLVIRELKQTDAAAKRRRSISNFLFRKTQGQVNSLGP